MAFNLSFNAHDVKPNVMPEPLPTGTYDVMITDTEEVLVKDGNGQAFIKVTMEVLGGEFVGRKIIDRLNTKNENEETRRIAYSTLSAICYVTGVMVIQQSSAELHGKPFRVRLVKEKRRDDPTKESNSVRGYLDSMGNEPGKSPGMAGGAPSASGFGAPAQTAPAGFGGAPATVQAAPAPSFAQQQQAAPAPTAPPAFVQQQPAAPAPTAPPTFAAPAPAAPAPTAPPAFAAPAASAPTTAPVADPAASAGSPIPSWATGG